MILNGYTVLEFGSALVRLAAALVLLALLIGRKRTPDRLILASMLGLLITGLGVASWPLWYAGLQSAVKQLPGAMCVYGVMQVGSGAGLDWLPGAARCIEWAKPLLVFLAGAWFCLYLLDRATPNARLRGVALGALMALGLAGAAEAGLESAYLASPRAESAPSPGCCVVAFTARHGGDASWGKLVDRLPDRWVSLGFYALTAALSGAFLLARRTLPSGRAGALFPLLGLALVEAPALWTFVSRSLAPRVLRQPGNYCPYDLLPVAPMAVAGMAVVLAALLCAGWAGLVFRFGRYAETRESASRLLRRLLALGAAGSIGGLALLTVCLVQG